jgi:hypothetical protein
MMLEITTVPAITAVHRVIKREKMDSTKERIMYESPR